jgi:hypothetical protein
LAGSGHSNFGAGGAGERFSGGDQSWLLPPPPPPLLAGREYFLGNFVVVRFFCLA